MYKTTINGSVVPFFLEGVAKLLRQNRNPTEYVYTFDAEEEELRIECPVVGGNRTIILIPYH